MYARNDLNAPSSASAAALAANLCEAILQMSTIADEAGAAFSSAARAKETLEDQAVTVERVLKSVRAQFEALAQLQRTLLPSLTLEQAGELERLTTEIRGRLGIAAGSLRRWTLGAQACSDASRQAAAGLTSLKKAIEKSTSSAEQLLLELE